jgi:RNA recognition motif-containing protein
MQVFHTMAHHFSRFSVMNLYVGNLSYQMTDDDLRAAFEAFGEVSSAKVIRDRETGRSKGFGFVEMPVDSEAEEAIRQMDNADLGGRNLKVNQARPRAEAPPRGRSRY